MKRKHYVVKILLCLPMVRLLNAYQPDNYFEICTDSISEPVHIIMFQIFQI